MLERPAKIATTGAALAVASFLIGLLHSFLPSFIGGVLCAIFFTVFVVVSAFFMVGYYVIALSLLSAVFILGNPFGLLLAFVFFFARRVQTKAKIRR